MNATLKTFDSISIVAPLGIRFRDELTGDVVSDGLNVAVYALGRPAGKVQAIANPSGIFVVHHAPGLISVEHGQGDADFWNNLPPKKNFVVAVTDAARRFQPFQLDVQLPERGVFNWASPIAASLPDLEPGIPLYSSPVRNVPPGMSVLRADLWDAARDLPAAWAILEAHVNNQLVARSIADDQGRIALIFPHPAPRPFTASAPLSSSPSAATGPPLTEQTWPVDLRALYAPIDAPALLPGELGLEQQLPDLRAMLSQPEATLWADSDRTTPLETVTLNYGRELILKSTQSLSLSPARQSVLFITSAVSPP
ncbi:MAG TPA: hypothetical protein VFI24_27225 [Pyrinomonadaceae bacterium]|nr:hypothetical protein [Pyrinomonadaceae bacterium]